MKVIRTLESLIGESGWFDGATSVQIEETSVSGGTADVSFVVPIYNQESLVRRCLDSIVSCSSGTYELCIIIDGCTDNTSSVVASWVNEQKEKTPSGMVRVIVASTSEGVFETISDSIGFSLTVAPIIIEVQIDMQILEPGFDLILTTAFDASNKVFAISGRGLHTIDHILSRNQRRSSLMKAARSSWTRIFRAINRRSKSYSPLRLQYYAASELGRVGGLIDKPARQPRSRKQHLYVGETIMRGPLALRRDRLMKLGGLDRARFFLGDDDHDLCVRAWLNEGWVAAYTPIAFSSPSDLGSTRKGREPAEQARFEEIRSHYAIAQLSSALRTTSAGGPVPRKQIYRVRSSVNL